MKIESALFLTQVLTAFALFLQSLENLKLYGEQKSWLRWELFRSDLQGFPGRVQEILSLLLTDRNFVFILILHLILSLCLFFELHPSLVGLLLLTRLLILIRFRGALNGGSDFMSVQLLVGLLLCSWGWTQLGLLWIALQSTLSYFLAGVAKVRQKTWRDGSALLQIYDSHFIFAKIPETSFLRKTQACRLFAGLVLIFELSFPLIFFVPVLKLFYLAIGVSFHFANFLFFSLNRFFWIWIATYPAIMWLSF